MEIETLKNGTKVYYEAPHTFGEDALLLAQFANAGVKPQSQNIKILDAGTGCGIIALYLYDRGFKGECTAIDISEKAIKLLKASLESQNIASIAPLCADMRELKANSIYDVMVCNPPYFVSGEKSPDAARANARHETQCTINDVCALAKRALKNGGKLCLCMKPQRLADVIYAMRANNLQPKRLQAVCNKTNYTPRLYLIEARKNRAAGLEVMPPIFP